MVEQFPFKEAVEGSNPSGLTASMRDRLMVGQQPLELFIQVRILVPQPVGSLPLCEDFFFLDSDKPHPLLYHFQECLKRSFNNEIKYKTQEI